ncbi:hypothetical protein SDC9_111390 [bioreactor metagenome]|uniref:Calcineurin-like phosphoesterase domain-containing protein n=1 Tax=bioreactor metagenome TaxID=1076179 RepID=A0A645BMJ4_9ZZZZ
MSSARELEVTTKKTITFKNSNKATATDLQAGKTYYYVYTENGTWSEAQSYTVKNTDNFSVLFVSDSQIGRSGDSKDDGVLMRDTCGWNFTMDQIEKSGRDIAFMISAGDQVEEAYSEEQYRAYLSPEILRSLPVANTIGNHDFYFPLYTYRFNNPNTVDQSFTWPAGEGYYYSYGDVLFIVMDSNNIFIPDQKKLLDAAIKAYPDAKYRVVTMHHSIYSDEDSTFMRALFVPLLDTYDIDLVLSGHDHFYTRSKELSGNKASSDGTVYLEASTCSGSNSRTPSYIKYSQFVYEQEAVTYTILNFSDDAINVETYLTDNNEIIDQCKIDRNTQTKSDQFSLIKWFQSFIAVFS